MRKMIRKAFKFRLNPNSDQAQKMIEFSGANRFVWNKALAMNLFRLEHKQPILWHQEMNFWLGLWKNSDGYGFLKTVHSQSGLNKSILDQGWGMFVSFLQYISRLGQEEMF